MVNNPKVSIVTVCYNAAAVLEETICSVISQTYNNIEYIIIDGGSKDGSVDIINKYKRNICFWCSENDNGIYDAMNKGVAYSHGDYILFLNAGDRLISSNILDTIFKQVYDDIDIIYGNCISFNANFRTLKKPMPIDKLWKGCTICHQSTLVRRGILNEHPFIIDYKYAADYEVLYYLKINNYRFQYINIPICYYSSDGVSAHNSLQSFKEMKKISLNYDYTIYHKLILEMHHYYIMIKYYLKLIFGKRLTDKINKIKYK